MRQPPVLELREVMRCMELVLRCDSLPNCLVSKNMALCYLIHAAKTATLQRRWPDTEGRSLIGTLRKAWGGEAPFPVAAFVGFLLDWRREMEPEDTAAGESIAMGVAHLLPVLR